MLATALKQYWGFDTFLPHQQEAMQCVLDGQDSLVVLPTGGGKSLCYQVPAMCGDRVAVVVSPLIALMKDQVDALAASGAPAAAIYSGMAADSKRRIARQIDSGYLRLLYLSPERLVAPTTLQFLADHRVRFFAIDEAHCISSWGHDFRPEYRSLSVLRDRFPQVGIHAYTATANQQVRDDVVSALRLRNPRRVIGSFHRPNLVYRVLRRDGMINQIVSVLERFRGQSGLIYCISRAETEQLSQTLTELGFSCGPYHAGLSERERTRRQNDFTHDRIDTIVATIAFGMGIDKSNVRFVIHAGMPKSLANYQQETGRAGRDGLEAECWLLYSVKDRITWSRTLGDVPEPVRIAGEASLRSMYEYCVATQCRHRLLLDHFDEAFDRPSCDACDICLGQLEQVDEPLVIGQKILSCVARVCQRFGAAHVAQVLYGSMDQQIVLHRHNQLSTHGLLREFQKGDIRDWIEQLIAQGFLRREGDYQVLKLTEPGRKLLQGEAQPTLIRPSRRHSSMSPPSIVDSWEGVDQGLFEELRLWRRTEAEKREVAAFIVFSDATLRDLARRRPSSAAGLRNIHGVGDQKLADFGRALIDLIVGYCREHRVALDQQLKSTPVVTVDGKISKNALAAFPLFDQRRSVADVAAALGRAESTAWDYLRVYVQVRDIKDPAPWILREEFDRILAVIRYAGFEKAKAIHEALHGRVSYQHIHVVMAISKKQALVELVPK